MGLIPQENFIHQENFHMKPEGISITTDVQIAM
jgi:hypothetical protein